MHRPGRSEHGTGIGGTAPAGRPPPGGAQRAVVLVATVSLPAAASSSGGVPAEAVSGLSVGVSPLYPGAQADYFVDFKATAGVAAGGDVLTERDDRSDRLFDRNDRTGARRDPGMAVPGLGRKVRARREHPAVGLAPTRA